MTSFSATAVRLAQSLAGALFFGALVTACGGGGDSSAPPQPVAHAPSVSNLKYSPTSVPQAAGSTATISGTFDFSDAGGDIASMRITSSGGADVSMATPQFSGLRSGTAIGQVVFATDTPGTYTFEVWVTDSTGLASNKLTGTVEVRPQPPPANHPPTISGLTYAPTSAVQSANGTTVVTGWMQFQDTGGDLALLHINSSWGTNQSNPANVGVLTTGQVSFYLTVPLSVSGAQSFRLTVQDANGARSNELVGSFDVQAAPASSHVPSVSNFHLSPSYAMQGAGTVPVSAGLAFVDTGADVVALHLVSTAGLDLTTQLPGYDGMQSGSITAVVDVSTASPGVVGFTAWVTDSKGTDSNRVTTSFEVSAPDSWVRLPVTPPAMLRGVTRADRYVAVGDGGTVMISTDLVGWTVRSAGADVNLWSVAGSTGGYIAVGERASRAVVLRSTDGMEWTESYRSASTSGSILSKVIRADGQYVAVGSETLSESGLRYALFLTSPDGVNWTQRAAKMFEVGDFGRPAFGVYSVAWSGSVYIAMGQGAGWDPTIWRSNDGIDWRQEGDLTSAAVWTGLYDVAWGSGRFVAVGPDGMHPTFGGHAPTFTSVDGLVWQHDSETRALPYMFAVAAGPTGYVAVGPEFREVSSDGMNWSPTPTTGCGNAVTWDGARYIAVGSSICRSP